ncbi:MAG TPA: branched-chain amino acid ABC transporter permease [Candidatus Limnocylindrales bacterium]|nr:branched-chain amino acid ABC transporter permease [Candidatus Limnocylindrales bacterium]
MSLRRLQAELSHRLAGALALLVLFFSIAWVLIRALGLFGGTGNLPQFIVVTLNGITLAGLYFIVASGFTLIFGLMRVVNMAHGSLYLLGGYLAFRLVQQQALNYWLALVLAAIAIGVVGLLMQQIFLRWNQGQDLRQALITIALSVVLADQMIPLFGAEAVTTTPPSGLGGSIGLGISGVRYPTFRLVVLGLALLIGFGLWFGIKNTRFGMIIRAGVDDRAMTSALGINVQLVFAVTFFIGALLAGLGGVLGGTMIALAPGQDASFLLSSLVVVIVGGMGSLAGAVIGALALGLVDQLSGVYLPTGYTNFSILLTFALLVFVLAVRPTGLFGRR